MLHSCWLPPRDSGCVHAVTRREEESTVRGCQPDVPKQMNGRATRSVPGQYGRCTDATAAVLETVCLGGSFQSAMFVPESQIPARPGAGNARQFFGGRFLCKIHRWNQSKTQEKCRQHFCRHFLGSGTKDRISDKRANEARPKEARKRRGRGPTARLDAVTHIFIWGREGIRGLPPQIKNH